MAKPTEAPSSPHLSRRQFVGATSAALAGLPMAGLLGSSLGAGNAFAGVPIGQPVSATDAQTGASVIVPGPPPKKLRYAIVGLGKFGVGTILPAFAGSQRSQPTALVSGDRNKARAIAAQYHIHPKNIYDYKNYDDIINNPEIDAVYIILPNSLHAEYTVRAAQAGKHVLCEKPLATSVGDAERMIAACKKADVKLMTAYRSQYEVYNRTLIQWTQEKKYGPAQMIVADHNMDIGGAKQWRLDPILSGGGSLVDIGVYSLNATRYLTGEEPIEINAMTHKDAQDSRFKHVEQTIAFQLKFPSGVLANCSSSYSMPFFNRYHVVASNGWYGLNPATAYHGQRLHHGAGETFQETRIKHNNQFAAMMDHFAKCVHHDIQPRTGGEEGLQDVRLMQLIYQAAEARETITV